MKDREKPCHRLNVTWGITVPVIGPGIQIVIRFVIVVERKGILKGSAGTKDQETNHDT